MRRTPRILALALALLGLALAQGTEVKVAVTANLRDAFLDIVRAFSQANPGVQVQANFGSSGAFTQQILQGAPFDLFLAADTGFPKALAEKGLAEEPPRVYARGKLILFLPKRVGIKPKDLAVLLNPAIRKVALANPEVAPYGRGAKEALTQAGLWEKVQPKLVYGQDIAQTAQLTLAAADAGFFNFSALFTPAFRNQGEAFVVPQRLYTPLDQAVVLLKGRARPEVRRFYAFLFGAEARRVLVAYGYQVP